MPAGHHPTSCKIEFPDALSTLPPLRQKFILASLPARLQFRLLAARDEDATGDVGQPRHGESSHVWIAVLLRVIFAAKFV